jgi:shikimate dehydrogenase
MKRAGVIGWPVEHSLSPVLHGYWLKQYGIDGSYGKIAAPPEDFAATIARLRYEGYAGVNVTVPHKEAAFALADMKNANARLTGAANLLVFTKEGKIGADNTDGTGLADSLETALGGAVLGGRNIVLLGAGGAARGALLGLYMRKVARITILNRHADRASQLADFAKINMPDGTFVAGPLNDWERAAKDAWLVINTTSAGMKGNSPLSLDVGKLPKTAAICDIVYNPLETPLLKEARENGHKTIDGLGMLMYQAKPAFEAFFGKNPEVTPGLRAALVEALEKR